MHFHCKYPSQNDDFSYPLITGNCILQLWMYRGALRACKCPTCTCSITKLTPETSLFIRQEKEVVDLLKGIQRYNRLYVGGLNGLLLVCCLAGTSMFSEFALSFVNGKFLFSFVWSFVLFLFCRRYLSYLEEFSGH